MCGCCGVRLSAFVQVFAPLWISLSWRCDAAVLCPARTRLEGNSFAWRGCGFVYVVGFLMAGMDVHAHAWNVLEMQCEQACELLLV